MSASRGKWHMPQAPTPRILHFPRRSRLSRSAMPRPRSPEATKPNLEALMRQESRRFLRDERRGKMATAESAGDLAVERWRFQVDILRAECNFLRMEREVVLRKVEKYRAMMESALRSDLEALIPGRKKIDGRGGSVVTTLDEEIEELKEKIEEIQGGCRRRRKSGRFGGNIDRRASVLCRRLQEVMVEEKATSVKEIREVGEIVDPASPSEENKERDDDKVEKLRRKMEGLSRGMRERMHEHGLLSLSFNTATAASEAVAGGRRLMFGGSANRRLCLRQVEEIGIGKEIKKSIGVGRCCNCKEFVERIAEQVRAEAEQWSEMQAMLDKVKADMEELRTSRDMWEQRAHSSELKVASLHSQILEWKRRPLPDSDQAAADRSALPTLSDQLHSEICRLKQLKIRERLERSCQDSHGEKVKRVLMCDRFVDSKSNHGIPPRRPPFQEIGNLNPKGIGQLEFASMR